MKTTKKRAAQNHSLTLLLRFASLVVPGIMLFVTVSCSLKLREVEAPPKFSPVGLWLYQDGPKIETFRISCTDHCWFRYVVFYFNDLLVSGKTIQQTSRSGYLTTSANELLLIQTEFRSEKISWSDDGKPIVTLDRMVQGESRYRHFTWNSENEVIDGNSFIRQCRSDCDKSWAVVLSLPKTETKLLISPDAMIVAADQMIWPAPLSAPYPGGMVALAPATSKDGALQLKTKSEVNLAVAYESSISLTPGARALEFMRKNQQAADIEKQKRRDEIRRRLKAGEPVSKEEMLEVLE